MVKQLSTTYSISYYVSTVDRRRRIAAEHLQTMHWKTEDRLQFQASMRKVCKPFAFLYRGHQREISEGNNSLNNIKPESGNWYASTSGQKESSEKATEAPSLSKIEMSYGTNSAADDDYFGNDDNDYAASPPNDPFSEVGAPNPFFLQFLNLLPILSCGRKPKQANIAPKRKRRSKYKKKPKPSPTTAPRSKKSKATKQYCLEDISVCTTCNAPFKTRNELLRHMKVQHGCIMKQEYKCDICALVLSR